VPSSQQFIARTDVIDRAVESEPCALPTVPIERVLRTCRLLWDERRFCLRLLLTALVGAIVVSLLLPPTYESNAVLIPSEPPTIGAMAKMGSLGNIASLAAGGGELLGMRAPEGRFVAILQSRTVADRLIDRFGLMKLYRASLRETARQILATRTFIVADRKTGLIVVTVQDCDRYRAAQIVEGYVAELDRLSSELNTGAAHRERLFLEERVAVIKEQMDAAAAKLANFSSTHGVMAVDEQAKTMMESAARLQGQITALEAQRQGLEQIYNPNNVRVRQIGAQIAALKQQQRKMRGSPAAPENSTELMPSFAALPTLGATYLNLWRENKILNAVFEVLTQQLELSRVEEAKELPTVRVLDRPNVAEMRVRPRRKMIVLVSCLLSLIFSVSWILVREKMRGLEDRHPLKSLCMEMAENFDRSRCGAWVRAARLLLLRERERFGSRRGNRS
jgi:capsule polysaccharide export protein KpsE/RkpR